MHICVGERLKVHKTITDAGFGLATSQAARHDGVANDGRGRVDNIGTLLFVGAISPPTEVKLIASGIPVGISKCA